MVLGCLFARRIICGLTQYTSKAHIARATLEAVCFQNREVCPEMSPTLLQVHHHMRYNMYNINYKSLPQHSRAEPVYSHTFALQLMEAMQTGLYTEAELVAAEANGADAVGKGRSQRRVEPMRSVRVDGGMCRSDVLMHRAVHSMAREPRGAL